MNLLLVKVPPHFWVSCLGCNERIGSINENVWANPEGQPFVAYYCDQCKAAEEAEAVEKERQQSKEEALDLYN